MRQTLAAVLATAALATAALAAVTIMLAACTDDPPPNVGALCTAAGSECDDELSCDTTFTTGYCTLACVTPGETAECPEGAICDSVSSSTQVTCLKICDTSADCRADLDCNGVSSSNQKACQPKP